MTNDEKGRREAKAVIRQRLRAAQHFIDWDDRRRLSAQLCEMLRRAPVWRQARAALLFAPMADEPDVTPLLKAAWKEGKRVAFPRFDGVSGQYSAALVEEDGDLKPGRFGVLEPAAHCTAVALNHLDFAIVPGIGFDLTGRRLGRGKGFYDRLLAQVHGHKCGVAFDTQVVTELPEEPHDVRLNSLVTPTRWHCCQRPA